MEISFNHIGLSTFSKMLNIQNTNFLPFLLRDVERLNWTHLCGLQSKIWTCFHLKWCDLVPCEWQSWYLLSKASYSRLLGWLVWRAGAGGGASKRPKKHKWQLDSNWRSGLGYGRKCGRRVGIVYCWITYGLTVTINARQQRVSDNRIGSIYVDNRLPKTKKIN